MLADTKKAAIVVIKAFNSLKAKVIVQEFIEEGQSRRHPRFRGGRPYRGRYEAPRELG